MLELLKQLVPLDLVGGASVWFKLPTIAHNLAVVDVAESWTAGSPRNQCDCDRPHGSEGRLDGTCVLHMCQDQSSSSDRHHTDAVTKRQLLSTDLLFDTAQRALYFRMINHLKMQKAHSKAGKAAALRRRFPAHPHEVQSIKIVKSSISLTLILGSMSPRIK